MPSTLWAKDLKITASIRPLQSIIANLTVGTTNEKIDLIVDQNESLHNYQLKPTKIRELYNSKMIIIVDQHFEVFLDKILASVEIKDKVIEVAKLTGIKLLKNEDEDEHEHEHEHENEHEHEHKGHHHHSSMYDYHLWLDVEIVKIISKDLSAMLTEVDPVNHAIYKQNLIDFTAKLDALDSRIKAKMLNLKNKNFIVVHNAYNYFINRYGLNKPRAITLDHDHNIGARSMLELQSLIKENKVQCIFEEPQFDAQIIHKLQENSKVKIGKLDAEWGPDKVSIEDAYIVMMDNLADSFSQCLQ